MYGQPPIDKDTGRLSRDYFFMNLAVMYRLRGTCPRLRVGCILVNEHRIVSAGYNSAPPGLPHCTEVGCLLKNNHCIRCPHAEIAAINNLEHRYDNLVAYVTSQPCYFCLRALHIANTKVVYFIKPFVDETRDNLANLINMHMIHMPWPHRECKDLLPFDSETYGPRTNQGTRTSPNAGLNPTVRPVQG